jgi:aminomethyltransferase
MDDRAAYEAIRNTTAVYQRGRRFVEVGGLQRGELLSWVLAKPTEYAQPGTSVDTLALDDEGHPIDLLLAIFEEDRTILISDVEHGVLDELAAIAEERGLTDVTVAELDGWCAVALEGPSCWHAVEDLVEDDLASMTLMERRTATGPNGEEGMLVRAGTTAEFGYLWVGQADAEAIVQAFAERAEELEGGLITADALLRANLEINHPVFPQMFEGLTLREAGVEWLAGAGRDDDYRGQPDDLETPRSRGLIAVYAPGHEIPPAGTPVEAGGVAVGAIFLAAPQVGQPDGFALALLDAPFDVPGLDLEAAGVALRTVSRPAVDPKSWTETIGSESIGSSTFQVEGLKTLAEQDDEEPAEEPAEDEA